MTTAVQAQTLLDYTSATVLGSFDPKQGFALVRGSDGDLYSIGSITDPLTNDDIELIQFGRNGIQKNTTRYTAGGPFDEISFDLSVVAGNRDLFAFAHSEFSGLNFSYNCRVRLVNPNGQTVKTRVIGGSGQETVENSIVIGDTLLAVFGHTTSTDGEVPASSPVVNGFNTNAWMCLLDTNLAVVDTITYGSSANDIAVDVSATDTFIVGVFYSPGSDADLAFHTNAGENDAFVANFSQNGLTNQWTTALAGAGDDRPTSVLATDSVIYLAGTTSSGDGDFINATSNVFLATLDAGTGVIDTIFYFNCDKINRLRCNTKGHLLFATSINGAGAVWQVNPRTGTIVDSITTMGGADVINDVLIYPNIAGADTILAIGTRASGTTSHALFIFDNQVDLAIEDEKPKAFCQNGRLVLSCPKCQDEAEMSIRGEQKEYGYQYSPNGVEWFDAGEPFIGNQTQYFTRLDHIDGHPWIYIRLVDHLETDLDVKYSSMIAQSLCVTWQGIQNVYPNPTTEVIHVDLGELANLSGSRVTEGVSYTIVNTLGQIVSQGELTSQTGLNTLDVSRLPNGMYTVIVKVQSGPDAASIQQNQMFVKQ